MKSNYKKLGPYIQLVNERNTNLQVDTLLGVSIRKCFMPSIANIIGTDMTTYKIVRKTQFAYGSVTSRNGDKISVAFMDELDIAMVSQAYTVFEVKDHERLDPEYLMMWFRRPEFDRYARFKSHGSAREIFDWQEMCEVELPIPSIEKQRTIVNEYNTVVNRIQLNEQLNQKLEETAQAIYKEWFVDFEFPYDFAQGKPNENGKPYKSGGGKMIWCEELEKEIPEGWEYFKIKDFGIVITGKTPPSNSPEDFGNDVPFITPGDFKNYNKYAIGSQRMVSKNGFSKLKSKSLKKGDIIITCIGSDMGKIAVAFESAITNQQMNSISLTNSFYSDFLFYSLQEESERLKSIAIGGSTMPMISKTDFEKINLLKPDDRILFVFEKITSQMNKSFEIWALLNIEMRNFKDLILSKMTNVEEIIEKETKH